jgi:hypothetical protein
MGGGTSALLGSSIASRQSRKQATISELGAMRSQLAFALTRCGSSPIDMSAHPTSPVIICGTYFSIFRPITLMEGKRIPPPEKAREKEYVTGGDKQSGGI